MTSLFDVDLPDGFMFVPGWLSVAEADALFAGLRERVAWEQPEGMRFGRKYSWPRLVCWYGDVEYAYSGVRHAPRPFMPEVAALAARAGDVAGTAFNGCLANFYRDGSDSVSWHADDEPVIDPLASIASISFGAARDFKIRDRVSRDTWSIALGHGDLLVMGPGTQASYQHAVPRRAHAGARLNLTLRRHHVPATGS